MATQYGVLIGGNNFSKDAFDMEEAKKFKLNFKGITFNNGTEFAFVEHMYVNSDGDLNLYVLSDSVINKSIKAGIKTGVVIHFRPTTFEAAKKGAEKIINYITNNNKENFKKCVFVVDIAQAVKMRELGKDGATKCVKYVLDLLTSYKYLAVLETTNESYTAINMGELSAYKNYVSDWEESFGRPITIAEIGVIGPALEVSQYYARGTYAGINGNVKLVEMYSDVWDDVNPDAGTTPGTNPGVPTTPEEKPNPEVPTDDPNASEINRLVSLIYTEKGKVLNDINNNMDSFIINGLKEVLENLKNVYKKENM